MTAETADQFDVVCDLLGSPRRRHLLSLLYENGGGTIDELSRRIAAREGSESGEADSEAAHEAVLVSLVHNHLPRLADHGVIEYDARSGDVVLSDGGLDLEPFIEQFGASSDGPTVAGGSLPSVPGTDQEC